MEILLQHLREHQEASFGMDRPDGSGRAVEEGVGLHTMPLRKYVSVFRIDGEPIIPPLMTSEKRRQMQILKEKAMRIEQRLLESKQSELNKDNNFTMDISSETSRSSLFNTPGNISQRSQDYYDAKLKESEESMIILRDIIRRQSAGEEVKTNACQPFVSSPRFDEQKLKKLQKSETLIYDNSTNEVIKQHQDVDECKTTSCQDKRLQLRELERMANLNYLQPKKPSQLLLAGINDKGGVSIPSICLNPPTPLAGVRKICETPASGNESNDSLCVAEANIQQSSHYQQDDISSDESFNSMLTHSDARPTTQGTQQWKNGIPRSGRIHDLKVYSSSSPSNVSSKIQQFESINSDHSSSTTTTPNSSPDKTLLKRSKLGLCSTSLSRSATSPSIKLSPYPPRPQTTPECSQIASDNTLVRSSSFTLEAPSKALIEHMRQQRSTRNLLAKSEVVPNILPLRKTASPSRVHRDTIESKAKRVQKVELKPSRQKSQQKANQHKVVHAAAATMSSPYSTTAFHSHSSTSNLYKSKKSPYDTPNSTRSMGHITKNSSTPVRKSPISCGTQVFSQKLNKSKSTKSVKQKNAVASPKMTMTTEKQESLTHMDKIQKEKFLRLLKHQEEEQRKLKHSFEMQQKLLMEQLNQEMEALQIKTVDQTREIHAATTSTQRSGSFNPEFSGFSSDSTYNQQQSVEDGDYSTKPFPCLTNNSTLLSENHITTENLCDQSLVPSLPISNLSSIDHSNANTSIESSTITVSNQLSQRTDSLHNVPTSTTPKENGHNGGGASGNLSSSRRRLFSQDNMSPSSHSQTAVGAVCSPPSSSNYRLSETHPHQHQQSYTHAKKPYVALANNANTSRRARVINDDNHVAANVAATTINAYARGFLIRRLFKTEQIQRIVQTIHDTLIFVLNLHIETCENPTEGNTAANIKLKARLLQQLSSATRTLHLVFFQTSVKERMEIIARDRKRLRTKLLAMNRQRTPRIAG